MQNKTTFTSVTQMVGAISENRSAAETIQAILAQQEIVSHLFAIRTAKGLSQGDIAKKMGCSQSRVSKLEKTPDSDVSIGDLAKYLDAVDLQLGLMIRKKDTTLNDELKYHVSSIRRILNKMANLVGGDGVIARGVLNSVSDLADGLIKLMRNTVLKVLPVVQANRRAIEIEDESLAVEVSDSSESTETLLS